MSRRHPHEGRVAELYRRNPAHRSGFAWVGYTGGPGHADHRADAKWDETLQAWTLDDAEPPCA
jgi:hypothetical protein